MAAADALAKALSEIAAGRGRHTHAAASTETDPEVAARLYGLIACPGVPISSDEARALLTRILGIDLAYGCGTDLYADADRLSRAVVDALPADTSFLTNALDPTSTAPSWSSCTTATFDSGVLAFHAAGSVCVWVEDED
jgi:hypothetical protein